MFRHCANFIKTKTHEQTYNIYVIFLWCYSSKSNTLGNIIILTLIVLALKFQFNKFLSSLSTF